MSRRIRRDTHKRVSSSGYQQMQGDLEVQGNLLGPAITNLNAAIAKISATSTTPVKLGAPVLEGGMRSITIRWGRQYNLANFSHYELQVSDDDESWYSLLLDGTGWKGNLSEDTDVKTEVFTHANIPLVEDAGDLVGISLYYRVRQVTFANAIGEWSDSAYATTKGVQDVVLTDSRNRYIEISSKKGIYADDRQGHVIHDIPNAPILTGMAYGGHIVMCDAAIYTTSETLEEVGNAAVLFDTDTGIVNTNISAHIPQGLTNVKACLVRAEEWFMLQVGKTAVGTRCLGVMLYSTSYNTEPAASNELIAIRTQSWSAAAYLEQLYSSIGVIPITWNAGIPYLTWKNVAYFADMAAGAADYSLTGFLAILGFLV